MKPKLNIVKIGGNIIEKPEDLNSFLDAFSDAFPIPFGQHFGSMLGCFLVFFGYGLNPKADTTENRDTRKINVL